VCVVVDCDVYEVLVDGVVVFVGVVG